MEVDIIRRIDLNMNEQMKYDVIKRLVENDGNKNAAALKLQLSRRQIDRLINAYKEKGKAAFVHGNRGRKPATTTPDETRQLVLDLYRTKYYDANFVHYTELLARNEGISLSVSCVTSILEAEYVLSPRVTKSKKKRIKKQLQEDKAAARSKREADKIQENLVAVEDAHSRRPRCVYFGEMLQMDASPFEWFGEGKNTLHIAVDDATGMIVGAYFDKQETLNGYYHVYAQILTTYGIPYKFFTDRRTVFTYKKKKAPDIGEDTCTQFAYACKQLGTHIAVLTQRQVDSGHCIQFENQHYRMINEHGLQEHYRKGTKVMVIKALDGNLYCSVNDKAAYALEPVPVHADKSCELDAEYEKPTPQKRYVPPMSHPWRSQSFWRFIKAQEHHLMDDLPA